VLWAVDGTPRTAKAVPWLHELVLPVTSRLTVLTVVPQPVLSAVRPDPAYLTHRGSASRAKELAEAEGIAQKAAAALDPSRSARIESSARWGHPVTEILKDSADLDLIVMAAESHSTPRVLAFGSVAEGVALRAGCPVLIARDARQNVRRVIIDYDGSPSAQAALRFLARLSIPRSVEYLLVGVAHFLNLPAGTPISYRNAALAACQEINANRRIEAENALGGAAKLLARGGRRVTTRIVSGEALQVMDDLARREDADLLVVGSGRSQPGPAIAIAKLVRHSHTSLLVVP
jgi:nucleotide-binding universal stress UspA family protein